MSDFSPQSDNINSPWPEAGIETVSHCPVCGSKDSTLLHTGITDRIFYCAPGSWNLVRCSKCESAYLNPRPKPETIHLAYQKYYTHKTKEKSAKITLGLGRRIMELSSFAYCNSRFGTALLPAGKFGALVMRLIPGKRKALDQQFRHLPRSKPDGRLLDIGFGDGKFLDLAKKAGWSVSGCDTDPVTIASAREKGLDVRQGGIEAFKDLSESFDVITLSHVIEHVHSPKEVSQEIFRLLKPGGQVWMETPNIQSYGHEQFAKDWRGLEPPRHLVLFNWNSLEAMLKEVGFSHIEKLPRYDVYARLAVKSRAIARGQDPYEKQKTERFDDVKSLFFNLKTRLHPNKSEFITLIAHKPKSTLN